MLESASVKCHSRLDQRSQCLLRPGCSAHCLLHCPLTSAMCLLPLPLGSLPVMGWTESLLSFLFGSAWTICWAPGHSSMFSALPVWISWDQCLLSCLLRLAKCLLSFPLDELSVSCPGRSVQSSVFHVRQLGLTHCLLFYPLEWVPGNCLARLNRPRLFVVFWGSVWSFCSLFRVIPMVHI